MVKLKLEEVAAKADEFLKLTRRIERKEKNYDEASAPVVEKHERKLEELRRTHAPQIENDIAKAVKLKAEISEWLKPKKSSWCSDGEIAEFGVTVGSKQGMRDPDKEKLRRLCKRKGVDYDAITSVLLGEADKALGESAVTAISTRPTIATRDVFIREKS